MNTATGFNAGNCTDADAGLEDRDCIGIRQFEEEKRYDE